MRNSLGWSFLIFLVGGCGASSPPSGSGDAPAKPITRTGYFQSSATGGIDPIPLAALQKNGADYYTVVFYRSGVRGTEPIQSTLTGSSSWSFPSSPGSAFVTGGSVGVNFEQDDNGVIWGNVYAGSDHARLRYDNIGQANFLAVLQRPNMGLTTWTSNGFVSDVACGLLFPVAKCRDLISLSL